jgi:hypothetical protein
MNELLKHIQSHAMGEYIVGPVPIMLTPFAVESRHEDICDFNTKQKHRIFLTYAEETCCENDEDIEFAKQRFFRNIKHELYKNITSIAHEIEESAYGCDFDGIKAAMKKLYEEIGGQQ